MFEIIFRLAAPMLRKATVGCALLGPLLLAAPAQAQVQRTMINLGFEQPDLGAAACYRHTDANVVPGWNTSQVAFADATGNNGIRSSCPTSDYPEGSSANGQSIELWANGMNGVFPREGTQHSELNSYSNSRLFQNVCLLQGETVQWRASHRGLAQAGSGTFDTAEFRIGAIPIARMRSNNLANGSVTVGAAGGDAAWAAGTNGWSDYSGTFAYSGANAVVDLGFEAISTSTGLIGFGNHLDAIQVTLRPFVEFAAPAYSMDEARPSLNIPRLRIAGTVPAGGMNVPITITGGTATLGEDYTTPGNAGTFNVFIPEGVYDLATFALPITPIDDGSGDPGETITFSTPTTSPADPYNMASLENCGGVPQATTAATLAEGTPLLNRVQLNKALASNRIAVSDQFQLRITGPNGQVANTTGSGSTVANGSIQVYPATIGAQYTLSEVMAAGSSSALSAYTSSISCTNASPTSTTVLPSGPGTSFNLTIAQDDNISCTITNRSTTAPSGISIVKSVTSGVQYASVGDVATYNYLVTNTGSTNLTSLTVTDNKIAAVSCGGITALAVGASVTCTGSYTVTQADIDAALVTNIAQARALNPSAQAVIATDDAVIHLALPSLRLEKATATAAYTTVGQQIPYTYTVTNTGNVTINNLSVTDDKVALISCQVTTLAPGASTVCNGTHTVIQADLDAGTLTNRATATGTPVAGVLGPVVDEVTLPGPAAAPALTLEKSASSGSPYDAVGDVIDYDYLVRNTGNITIDNLTVIDDKIATVTCQVTTLAPGASITCTATYTVTQADLDAGSVTNNATVNGAPARGTLNPATDSETVFATAEPAWTLSKNAVSGTPYSMVGATINYEYVVANTGNVTISNLSVSDDKIASVSCPATTLAPGASTTCTGTHTVTQADLDAGTITNNATAAGTPAQGALVPATDNATVNVDARPSWTLAKSATSGMPYDAVGDVVTYIYVVANTGNMTIDNVAVTDDKIATVSCPSTTLAPGASMTCTGTHTVTQADLDAGSITNNASASGTPSHGTLGSATDSETVSVDARPALSMDKSAISGFPYGVLGDVVLYHYVVTNTGNVTIHNLAVSDNRIASVSCPDTTLAPGASTTCTASYTITQADLDAGSVTNTASATGTPTQGTLAPAGGSETVNATAEPELVLDKRVASGNPYDAQGDVVSYEYEVTNTGNVTISNLTVADDKIAAVSCPVTTLAPGASTTCTASYTIAQADLDAGSVTNNASASGSPAQGVLAPATDSAVATSSATPALTLEKSAVSGMPYDAVGDVVTYEYVVTNPSSVTINAISVSDDKIAVVNCPVTTLGPGASMTCTASYTITQADLDAGSVINNATANGTPTSGVLVPGTDSETVNVDPDPRLTMDKTAASGVPYDEVGDVIAYNYLLTNTGNVTINNLSVSDDRIATVSCPVTTLAPGASTTCTATHNVTQADLDAGSITNNATANGSPTHGALPPPPDTETANADVRPALTMDKSIASGDPFDAVGDVIEYRYLVTNTGNVTISNLAVSDDKIATVTCPVTVLAPGESTTCTGTCLATQADLDAGGVTNNASAIGTPAQGALTPATDTITATATPAPALTLDKTIASGSPFDSVGDVVTYEYRVTNTGNMTVSGLNVADDKIATVSCPVTTLAPGASTTCTASYTITQADLDAGSVTNNASASGTPAQGTLTPATDSVSAFAEAAPALSMVKTAVSGEPYRTVGVVIAYEYVVTNTGNVTVSTLIVEDDKIATVSCPVTTLAPGASTTCTASYTITQADLDAGSVTNHALAQGVPAQGLQAQAPAEETVSAGAVVTYQKAANTAGPVTVGQTISYALTVTVLYAPTAYDKVLTDTLGTGLTFNAVTTPGAFTCSDAGNVLTCRLPAGQPPGTYTVGYTATVNADATGTVNNAVVGASSDPNDPAPPSCVGTCTLSLPVTPSAITYAKVADTAGPVSTGDTITYTLTATVLNSQTTAATTLTDTLGAGLAFGSVTDAGVYTCNANGNVLTCSLPAGTVPGTYEVRYTATVTSQATGGGTVDNAVTGSGGGGAPPTCGGDCSVSVNVAASVIDVIKTSDPNSETEVEVGQTISYTLTATIANAALNADLVLTDTPATGLTIGTLPSGCSMAGGVITCIVPAGTLPGTYAFTYPATVNDQADTFVNNNVLAESSGNLTTVACTACQTLHTVAASDLRLAKVASVREVRIGDLVRYTLTVQNLGGGRLRNGTIVDTPPAGFTYVEGSLVVDDADDAGTVEGQHPLRFGGIDIAGNDTATLVYLMRVGAGVRPGVHENQAQAFSPRGEPISNLATAKVELVADPLLEDSLIFGTVFNDCDGDGWQDEGERGIPGVRIASVEGLLTETDQHGRYHLAGIPGGAWERGRNFILKVDPSTLPEGATFSTDNPLVRRITPGVPVRFDWGVKRCVVEEKELQLGTVFFAPGSAEVQAQHAEVIATMAARINEYGGGDVVIEATGDSEALSLQRAQAVREALLKQVAPPAASKLQVLVRSKVDDPNSLMVGVDEGGALLGTVLFDTDQATIKPEFESLLDQIATLLQQREGGVVTVVGHTDVRGSHEYNTALGLRRAQAVSDALMQRLPEAVRSEVQVRTVD